MAKRGNGKTRQEVAKKLTPALKTREQGLPFTPDRLTVARYLDEWLEQSARPKLRVSRRQLVYGSVEPCISNAMPTDILSSRRLTSWFFGSLPSRARKAFSACRCADLAPHSSSLGAIPSCSEPKAAVCCRRTRLCSK